MKKKILIIFVLYLIMSIFLYPLRESIWYNLFYTIAYMIAVMIYFSLIKKKEKKWKICLIKKNHILCEIVPGSVAFACFYLSISISSVFQFLLVVINLASILVTVYLTREMRIKEFEDDDLVSPRTNQLMFIGLADFMFVICLYRGISETEFYQQLIAYIGVFSACLSRFCSCGAWSIIKSSFLSFSDRIFE